MRAQIEATISLSLLSNLSHDSWRVARCQTDPIGASLTTLPLGLPEAWQPLTQPQGNTDSSEWDMLFSAVTLRMRQLLATATDAADFQSRVDECLHALESLQAMLAQERQRATQINCEVDVAKVTIEAASAALNSSCDGDRLAQHLARHDNARPDP